jgi:membrane associated rhomboid family serine protease
LINRSPYQAPTLNPIWAIIGVNLLIFIFTLIKPVETDTLLGLTPAFVSQHPWTLISSMFVHDGFSHIFFNMLTFYFFGSFLLNLVGDWKFLLVYFGGGLLGSFVFWALGPSYATAVGASGAIFALGGALAVLSPTTKVLVYFILPVPLWAAVIFGFLIVSFLPGVAWQAHLGGLVFGLVAGYFFRRQQFRRVQW